MRFYNLRQSFKIAKVIVIPYFKSLLKPFPVWVHLYVTRKCNLNCPYCFVRDNNKEELTEKEWEKAIDKLYSLGARLIAFMGGEPTIRKDFINLVQYTHQKGMGTQLSTNGILLTPEYIEKLGKAGIDTISLSVDSLFESQSPNKNYRKNEKILNDLIEARKKYKFEITVNAVMTNQNIESIPKIIELTHNLKIPISLGFINRNTYSQAKQNESLFFNTNEEKEKLFKILDEIKKLRKEGYNIIEPANILKILKNLSIIMI